jgi:hypothetical protein
MVECGDFDSFHSSGECDGKGSGVWRMESCGGERTKVIRSHHEVLDLQQSSENILFPISELHEKYSYSDSMARNGCQCNHHSPMHAFATLLAKNIDKTPHSDRIGSDDGITVCCIETAYADNRRHYLDVHTDACTKRLIIDISPSLTETEGLPHNLWKKYVLLFGWKEEN